MITTLNTNSNPQPSWGVQSSTVPIYTPTGRIANVISPIQVVGLVPLVCVDIDPRLPAFSKCDCREWTNDNCYINPVFASTADSDPLKNDHNMFLLEYPFFYSYQWTDNVTFALQQFINGTWSSNDITPSGMGTHYDFAGDLCIKNWTGIDINWRNILIAFGEGLYRFSVTSTIFGTSSYLVSEPFCLKE